MAQTDPAKTGLQTTEFFSMLAGVIAIGAVSIGLITADQQKSFEDLIQGVFAGGFAIIAIAGIVMQYIKSRQEVKIKLIEYGTSEEAIEPTAAVVA